jgi:hypothetical protein
MRLEAHVAVAGNVCTPSFASREDLEQLRALCSGAAGADNAAAQPAPSASGGAAATPAGKRGPGTSVTPAPGGTPSSSKGETAPQHSLAGPAPLPTLGLDELALLAGDVQCVESWLATDFSASAASALVLRGAPVWSGGPAAVDLNAVDAVRGTLQQHTARLRRAREAVWAKVGVAIGKTAAPPLVVVL